MAHRICGPTAPLGDRHCLSTRSNACGPGTSTGRFTVGAMSDSKTPWEPPLAGTETEHLTGALDRLRTTFRRKTDGLDRPGCKPQSAPPR